MTVRSVHVYIEGRVQGVWYRGWTRQTASRLGLQGWVRNLRDGRVEAIFCGPSDKVALMLQRCASGPPLAKVTNIVLDELDETDFVGFETKPTI